MKHRPSLASQTEYHPSSYSRRRVWPLFLPLGVLFIGVLLTTGYLLQKGRTYPYSPFPQPIGATPTVIQLSLTPVASSVIQDKRVPGWQTYLSREEYALQTNDWFTYTGVPNIHISYTFQYPNDWKVERKQLIDPEGNIVGATSVVLKAGQSCFDVPYDPQSSQYQLRLISQDTVAIEGRLPITRRLFNYYDVKYLVEYCLSEGGKAVIMSFEGKKLDAANEKIFEQILSTFRFLG